MGISSSNTKEDTNYINESKIEGHGNTIPTKQLKDIIKKGENAMVKIKYIYFFFLRIILMHIFHLFFFFY